MDSATSSATSRKFERLRLHYGCRPESEVRRSIRQILQLVGYKAEELIGTPYDHLTVPNTAEILTTYNLLMQLGYMHGLWMLAHRTGYRIVIRYEAWLRPDANIQSNIELVQTIL